jgi:hypothetical protein
MQGDFLINLDEQSGVNSRVLRLASWCVRLGLAVVLVSLIAERLGLWGPPDPAAPVFWFVPGAVQRLADYGAVTLQLLLLLALLVGRQLRSMALATAIFLLLYGAVRCVAMGALAPRSSLAFAAASAAFMLFAIQPKNSKEV